MFRSILALLALFAVSAVADEPLRPKNLGEVPRVFSAACDMTLSGAVGSCTIQQPATGANKVRLISASIYCSVACTVTQNRNGTAATTTAASVRDVNGKGVANTANVFTNSNVGAGSIAVDPIQFQATIETGLGYENTVYLVGSGTTNNYTWTSSSITGNFKVTVMWEEYN